MSKDGRVSGALLDREQHAAHGFAWLFTYVQAIRQMAAYAERMQREGRLGELEALIVQVGIGEYLAQMQGGIPMSQGEIVRAHEMGLSDEDLAPLQSEPLRRLVRQGNTPTVRARIIALMKATEGQRHVRRYGPGRNLRSHARPDAQVRRRQDRAGRPPMASDQFLHSP